MIGYGRGGGGGFGGFPYRSSHQQGQDGNNNRNGNGRGRGRGGRGRGGGRQKQRSKRNNTSSPLSFQAELSIPSQQRGIIVGRSGTTIKWLKECSGAKIFVPSVQQQQRQSRRGRQQEQQSEHTNNNNTSSIGAPQTAASSTNYVSTNSQSTASTQQQQPHQTQVEQHPVRVNTNELSNLLHAFSEISTLLSTATTTYCTDSNDNIQDGNDGDLLLGENNNHVHCIVKMKSHGAKKQQPGAQPQRVDVKVDGHLFLHPNHHDEEATQEGTTNNTNNGTNNGQSQKHENQGSLERMLLFQGTIMNNNSNNAHSSTQHQLLVYQAYCIPTPSLLEEDIATIVDNVRFVNNPSSMGDDDELCQWFYREIPLLLVRNNNNSNLNNKEEQGGDGMDECSSDCCVRRLVFVFGPEVGNPLSICQAIVAEQSQRGSVAED